MAKRETGEKERQGITVTRRARGDNASLLAALLSVLRPGRYTLSANLKKYDKNGDFSRPKLGNL